MYSICFTCRNYFGIFLTQSASSLTASHKGSAFTQLNAPELFTVIGRCQVEAQMRNAQLVRNLTRFDGPGIAYQVMHPRHLTTAAVELKTDDGVVRFSISRPSDKDGSPGKVKKIKKRKMSRKAKLNELRFYRLKAKKKMNSPNPEVRIRYKLDKVGINFLLFTYFSKG